MKSFVLISLKEGSERRIMQELKEYPQVSNGYFLFGEWDILLEVDIAQAEELGTFVINEIRNKEDVKLTSSLIVAGK